MPYVINHGNFGGMAPVAFAAGRGAGYAAIPGIVQAGNALNMSGAGMVNDATTYASDLNRQNVTEQQNRFWQVQDMLAQQNFAAQMAMMGYQNQAQQQILGANLGAARAEHGFGLDSMARQDAFQNSMAAQQAGFSHQQSMMDQQLQQRMQLADQQQQLDLERFDYQFTGQQRQQLQQLNNQEQAARNAVQSGAITPQDYDYAMRQIQFQRMGVEPLPVPKQEPPPNIQEEAQNRVFTDQSGTYMLQPDGSIEFRPSNQTSPEELQFEQMKQSYEMQRQEAALRQAQIKMVGDLISGLATTNPETGIEQMPSPEQVQSYVELMQDVVQMLGMQESAAMPGMAPGQIPPGAPGQEQPQVDVPVGGQYGDQPVYEPRNDAEIESLPPGSIYYDQEGNIRMRQ